MEQKCSLEVGGLYSMGRLRRWAIALSFLAAHTSFLQSYIICCRWTTRLGRCSSVHSSTANFLFLYQASGKNKMQVDGQGSWSFDFSGELYQAYMGTIQALFVTSDAQQKMFTGLNLTQYSTLKQCKFSLSIRDYHAKTDILFCKRKTYRLGGWSLDVNGAHH